MTGIWETQAMAEAIVRAAMAEAIEDWRYKTLAWTDDAGDRRWQIELVATSLVPPFARIHATWLGENGDVRDLAVRVEPWSDAYERQRRQG